MGRDCEVAVAVEQGVAEMIECPLVDGLEGAVGQESAGARLPIEGLAL